MRRTALAALLLVTVAGCGGKDLQDRHYYSRLDVRDDRIVFEATATPEYPIDSPEAEMVRSKWLAQWMAIRELCPDGYRVVRSERIGPLDDNPYRHDLRYTVVCDVPDPEPLL